jgi:hypothetical protein
MEIKAFLSTRMVREYEVTDDSVYDSQLMDRLLNEKNRGQKGIC